MWLKGINVSRDLQGNWIDKHGKTLIIEHVQEEKLKVTILGENGNPYKVKLLGDKSTTTENLIARITRIFTKRILLEVEAGELGIGPTYNLTLDYSNKFLLNNELIIKPSVGMGLYDDWEDDLGVPWAFPLSDFKKIN